MTPFPQSYFHCWVVLGLMTLAAQSQMVCADETSAAAIDRPNIVLIVADDLGYGDLHCFGHPFVRTPHFDRLAEQGVRLTDFYADAPICSPTRASLLTGQVPQRHGLPNVIEARDETTHLSPNQPLLPEILRNAGYQTALFGKWHLGSQFPYRPLRRGFETFFGGLRGGLDFYHHDFVDGSHDLWQGDEPVYRDGQYITDLIGQEAERYIDDWASHGKQRPFFCYLAFHAVHVPMGHEKPHSLSVQYTDEWFATYAADPTARETKRARREMAACVSSMDEAVGRIVAALERHGELNDRTLIFFTSDNGPLAAAGSSAAPFRGGKHSLWEGGIRMPAIAFWPGRLPANSTSTVLGITHDVLPTLVAAAGVRLPSNLIIDGRNLLPTLEQAEPPHVDSSGERTLVWSYVRDSLKSREKAVRRGTWKWLDGELYNLTEDPGEKHNLATSEPGRAADMEKVWNEWVAEFPAEVNRWHGRSPQRRAGDQPKHINKMDK